MRAAEVKPLHSQLRSTPLTTCGALVKRVKVTKTEAEVTCGNCRRLSEASLPFNPMWRITHGEPFVVASF